MLWGRRPKELTLSGSLVVTLSHQHSTLGWPPNEQGGHHGHHHIDLPGVDPSTIDVDVEERTLTIRAERRDTTDEDVQWLSHERPTGTFARQLTLGYGVAPDRIEADYSDGVLTLTIPVADEAKPRKISVSHKGSRQFIEGEASAAQPAGA